MRSRLLWCSAYSTISRGCTTLGDEAPMPIHKLLNEEHRDTFALSLPLGRRTALTPDTLAKRIRCASNAKYITLSGAVLILRCKGSLV